MHRPTNGTEGDGSDGHNARWNARARARHFDTRQPTE
jgi:hypothetical protein